ncbi:hypothetical protein EJF18_50653 [Clavispora lusitaniae]|uniref:Uncharacterized protein n=1 Tax=Clavispora lusitaniae TaxID=36911 RepID=A0ACD0WPY8_CLALS|nr:hypothetical protein EJF14_50653 [Clavispora lusitaniae]QFZ35076.1 hypothetical protein EJF16_50653 [Clavispora lusitaniae]QFZ40761.1 hypothetical protein EJF15_50653 [Clavispora lusitaniae]QFZ46441.1 hypothetical protein EJF18_50653 [Clavispora lusitaniae]QFZ52103.1 hypothetical protein EJF17_50653 [Clavispora lusitaniae]
MVSENGRKPSAASGMKPNGDPKSAPHASKYRPRFKNPPLPAVNEFRLDHILANPLRQESGAVVQSLLNVNSNYQKDLRSEIRRALTIEQKIQFLNIRVAKLAHKIEKRLEQRTRRIGRAASAKKTGQDLSAEVDRLLDSATDVSQSFFRLVQRAQEQKAFPDPAKYPRLAKLMQGKNGNGSTEGSESFVQTERNGNGKNGKKEDTTKVDKEDKTKVDKEDKTKVDKEDKTKVDTKVDKTKVDKVDKLHKVDKTKVDIQNANDFPSNSEHASPISDHSPSHSPQEDTAPLSRPIISTSDTHDEHGSLPNPVTNGSFKGGDPASTDFHTALVSNGNSESSNAKSQATFDETPHTPEEMDPAAFELLLEDNIAKYRDKQAAKYSPTKAPDHAGTSPLRLLYSYSSLAQSDMLKPLLGVPPSGPFTAVTKACATVVETPQTSLHKKLRITSEPSSQQLREVIAFSESEESAVDDTDLWTSSGIYTESDESGDSSSEQDSSSDCDETSRYYMSFQKKTRAKKRRPYKRMSPTPKHHPSHRTLQPKKSILKMEKPKAAPKTEMPTPYRSSPQASFASEFASGMIIRSGESENRSDSDSEGHTIEKLRQLLD